MLGRAAAPCAGTEVECHSTRPIKKRGTKPAPLLVLLLMAWNHDQHPYEPAAAAAAASLTPPYLSLSRDQLVDFIRSLDDLGYKVCELLGEHKWLLREDPIRPQCQVMPYSNATIGYQKYLRCSRCGLRKDLGREMKSDEYIRREQARCYEPPYGAIIRPALHYGMNP